MQIQYQYVYKVKKLCLLYYKNLNQVKYIILKNPAYTNFISKNTNQFKYIKQKNFVYKLKN